MSRSEARAERAPAPPAARGRPREVALGAFVLLGLAAILAVLFTFADVSVLRGRYRVTVLVDDAGGLRRGDMVQLRGVNIGRVKGFEISRSGEVAVRLELEGAHVVPRDSRVELRPAGVLGGMTAKIVPGSSAEALRRGDVLSGARSVAPLEAAGRLAEDAEHVLGRLQALLSERTVSSVEASTGELQQLLLELSRLAAEQRASLSELTRSLGATAGRVERLATGPELERIVKRLDHTAARVEGITPSLEQTASSLERSARSLEEVVARVARGEGTLGRLLKDETLYVNANQALFTVSESAAELGKLAEDVRRNPKRYVNLSLF